jgi:hypothetical protein
MIVFPWHNHAPLNRSHCYRKSKIWLPIHSTATGRSWSWCNYRTGTCSMAGKYRLRESKRRTLNWLIDQFLK